LENGTASSEAAWGCFRLQEKFDPRRNNMARHKKGMEIKGTSKHEGKKGRKRGRKGHRKGHKK
jgi:hypothetical protein